MHMASSLQRCAVRLEAMRGMRKHKICAQNGTRKRSLWVNSPESCRSLNPRQRSRSEEGNAPPPLPPSHNLSPLAPSQVLLSCSTARPHPLQQSDILSRRPLARPLSVYSSRQESRGPTRPTIRVDISSSAKTRDNETLPAPFIVISVLLGFLSQSFRGRWCVKCYTWQ